MDDDKWENNFLSRLNESEDVAEDEESEVDEDHESKNESSVKNVREAIVSLEQVQRFLQNRGHCDISESIGYAVDKI